MFQDEDCVRVFKNPEIKIKALAVKVIPAANGKKKRSSSIPQAKRPKANVQEIFFTSAEFCDVPSEINQSINAIMSSAIVTQ